MTDDKENKKREDIFDLFGIDFEEIEHIFEAMIKRLKEKIGNREDIKDVLDEMESRNSFVRGFSMAFGPVTGMIEQSTSTWLLSGNGSLTSRSVMGCLFSRALWRFIPTTSSGHFIRSQAFCPTMFFSLAEKSISPAGLM